MDELQGFENYLKKRKRRITSDGTIIRYRNLLGVMLRSFSWSEEGFDNFIYEQREKGKSGSLINKYITTGKYYCQFLGVDFRSGAFERVPEESPERVPFTDSEIEQIVNLPMDPEIQDYGSHSKWTMFWKCVAYSGCRPGEMVKMDIDHVDFANNCFIFEKWNKTKRGRLVIIFPGLREELRKYISELKTKLLFTPGRGKERVMSPKAWDKDIKRRLERVGIKRQATAYTFRHSWASDLLKNEASFPIVSTMLGHTNPKTTMIYNHTNLVAQEKAIKHHTQYEKFMTPKEHAMQWIAFIQSKKPENIPGMNYQKVLDVYKAIYDCVDK